MYISKFDTTCRSSLDLTNLPGIRGMISTATPSCKLLLLMLALPLAEHITPHTVINRLQPWNGGRDCFA